jgi:hypothetical protein
MVSFSSVYGAYMKFVFACKAHLNVNTQQYLEKETGTGENLDGWKIC